MHHCDCLWCEFISVSQSPLVLNWESLKYWGLEKIIHSDFLTSSWFEGLSVQYQGRIRKTSTPVILQLNLFWRITGRVRNWHNLSGTCIVTKLYLWYAWQYILNACFIWIACGEVLFLILRLVLNASFNSQEFEKILCSDLLTSSWFEGLWV